MSHDFMIWNPSHSIPDEVLFKTEEWQIKDLSYDWICYPQFSLND